MLLDPGFALAHAGDRQRLRAQYYEWHEQGGALARARRGPRASARSRSTRACPRRSSARARLHYTQRQLRRLDPRRAARDRAQEGLRRAPTTSWRARSSSRTAGPRRWRRSTRRSRSNGDDYNVYVPFTNMFEGLGRTEGRSRKLREREIAVLEQQLQDVPEDVARAHPARRRLRGHRPRTTRPAASCRRAVDLRPERLEHPLQRRLHLRRA